jgi:hypothetical protein
MKKTNEFRIVEQLGKFCLERKYIVKEKKHNFWSKWFPFLFFPNVTEKEKFYKLDDDGNACNIPYTYPIAFRSYEEAISFYECLDPKYHPIEKTE